MTTSTIFAIIIAVLGSTGLFTFIQFLITRKDNAKKEKLNNTCSSEAQLKSIDKKIDMIADKISPLEHKIDSLQKDSCRTQLMLLIKSYPTKVDEILLLAKRYFVELKGNTYMVSLFEEWLNKKQLERPEWFDLK